jgi:D-lactate dehydrogenase
MSAPPFDFVSTTLVDRLVMAHDASLYRLVPSAVARPRDRRDLLTLLDWCRHHQQHMTFRAAGTSLSGQAVTDGVLVDLSRHWDRITISDNGDRVCVYSPVSRADA